MSNQQQNQDNTPVQSKLIGLAPLMRKAFAGVDMKPLGMELIAHAIGRRFLDDLCSRQFRDSLKYARRM